MTSDLAIAEDNARFLLRQHLDRIAATGPEARLLFAIGAKHRTLALAALLARADVATFVGRLSASAGARLALLRLAQGPGGDARLLCLSKDRGFEAALAAGDLGTATAIAREGPHEWMPRAEYEDDFLFARVQRLLLLSHRGEKGADAAALLPRLRATSPAPDDPAVLVANSLVHGDASGFAAAMQSFLEARSRHLDGLRGRADAAQDLLTTEGAVSVQGLGLLRLAEVVGMARAEDLPLIPAPAVVAAWKPDRAPRDWRWND